MTQAPHRNGDNHPNKIRCVSVSPSGTVRTHSVLKNQLDFFIETQVSYRPHHALLINGEIAHCGDLTVEECQCYLAHT